MPAIVNAILITCLDWIYQKGYSVGEDVIRHQAFEKYSKEIDLKIQLAEERVQKSIADLEKRKDQLSKEELDHESDKISDDFFDSLRP